MYKKGDVVKCRISGFKDYGIFVYVDENYSGLIHISEISQGFVRNVVDYGELNEIIYAKVIDVDEEAKQLKLTIKNINYKIDGEDVQDASKNGFLPLKKQLNVWINDKIKEISRHDDK